MGGFTQQSLPRSAWPSTCLHLLMLTSIILYVLRRLRQRATLSRRRCQVTSDHGCLKTPQQDQKWWCLGIDVLLETNRNRKSRTCLEVLQARFTKYGNTYTSHALGLSSIVTIDPANIQAVLKTKAEDYEVRSAREIPLGGLVGPGILTTDGDVWRFHRNLIKPSFGRSRLGDLTEFEEHTLRLLRHLPPSGTAIDLQELFLKFTLDTSTKHLFGTSSGSLATLSDVKTEPELAGAFNRSQRAAVTKSALGWADRLRPQPQYWLDTYRIRRYADRYLSLIHTPSPRDGLLSRMPSSA